MFIRFIPIIYLLFVSITFPALAYESPYFLEQIKNAEKGHALAQYEIGFLYQYGINGPVAR